jgi:hypothetical protein
VIVIDDFLDNYSELKEYSKAAKFKEETNAVDGAVYPAICLDVPVSIRQSVVDKIQKTKGYEVNVNLMFLRANPKGSREPYQAHNDLNMGSNTLILYLKNSGGTAFVEHIETGMNQNNPNLIHKWLQDCNVKDAWRVTDLISMKENRALFFDAEMMHRGEPVEGYGEGADSRMILVCFFDRK